MKFIIILLIVFFGSSFLFSIILKKMRRIFIGDVEEQRREMKENKNKKDKQ